MSEARLIEAKSWFGFFAEQSSAPMLIAESGKVLAANPALLKLLGYLDASAVCGCPLADLFFEADRKKVESYWRSAAAGSQLNMPARIRCGTAEPRWVSLEGRISTRNGNSYLLLSLIADASSEVEKQLARIDRALRLLSASNQSLVRSFDELRLLQDVCDLCVSQAGYPMAWVGYAIDDDCRSVEPAAQTGIDADYIRSLKAGWGDHPGRYNTGPSGSAIRLRTHRVEHSVTTNPNCQPWHSAAARFGVNSIAALPLIFDDNCFGVLTVCAAEAEAFDGQELALLDELADDLAFGIGTLRRNVQRIAAEERLRQSERLLNEAQVIANMGSWAMDVPTQTAVWSQNMYPIFDVDPANVHAVTVSYFADTMCHPEDVERVLAALNEAFSKGVDYDVEYRIRHRDGSIRHIWGHGRVVERDSAGKPLRMLGTAQDITARKENEEKLGVLNEEFAAINEELRVTNEELSSSYQLQQESEERYRNMVEASPDGIAIVVEGQIVYANDALLQIHGATDPGQILGQHVLDFVPREDHARAEDLLFGTAQPGKVTPLIEGRIVRIDGSIAEIELKQSYTLLNGRPAIQIFVRDVTGRRQLERQLAQMQRLDAIGTLAGGIAHDFNNVLSGILGYADLVADDLDPESEAMENLQEITNASLRARDLIQQILTFSRRSEHLLAPVRISQVVREALKLLRASLPATISFRSSFDSPADVVLADPTQIHQIVMNLATNAGNAMPNGGVLEVSVRLVELDSDTAAFNGLLPGPHVLMTMADSGCGMSKEVIERIFEPFFTTKPGSSGTGLGLSVVYGIVKAMNGAVTVYSEPQKGSVFHVYLPQYAESAQSATIDSGRSARPRGSGHILVVDDEHSLMRLAERILVRLGYRVSAFSSSPDALEAFMAAPDDFDLLFTDQTMPEMTGINLARRLLELRPALPVVLATGFVHAELEKEALAAGIREFVAKPLVAETFALTLQRALQAARSDGEV